MRYHNCNGILPFCGTRPKLRVWALVPRAESGSAMSSPREGEKQEEGERLGRRAWIPPSSSVTKVFAVPICSNS